MVGVWPTNWVEVIGYTLLILAIFITLGTLIGTLLKQRQPVTALAMGISVPLFFLSGAFGPLSFDTPATQFLAKLFPVYYSIVLQQHAFHNFRLDTLSPGLNAAILVGYALVVIALAVFAVRRTTVAH